MSSKARLIPSIPIRYAIPGILALLIIVAVGLTAWLSFRSGQTSANEVANQLSRKVADRIQERVLTFIEVPHQFHEINLAAVHSGNLNLSDFDELRRYFWNQVYIAESVPYLYYGTEEGNFLGIDTNFGEQGAVFKIRDSASAPKRLTYKLDEDGNPVGESSASEYDPRVRPWYQAAVKAGLQPTWSPVYLFSARRELGISPVTPVYDDAGQLMGVLGIDLTLADLTDFLRSLQPSPNGKAFILQGDGTLIATSASEDPFLVVKTTNDAGEEVEKQEFLKVISSTDTLINATAGSLLQNYGGFDHIPFDVDPTDRPQPRAFTFDLEGQRQLGQVVPVTDSRGLSWLIVVVIPANDFMAPVYENVRNTFVYGGIVLVVAALLGFVFASWVIRPVTAVSNVAASIEQEQYALAPLDAVGTRSDELGQLARVFKRMATEVYQREQQLKQQVAQLQIEIDEVKRQKQVAEIADTDFFRDLQSKARNMREAKSRRAAEPDDASAGPKEKRA